MGTRVRAFALSALLASTFLAIARPSSAADDPAALARAKAHFENGVHLYDAKPPDYEGALAEFRAAEKEKASPGIKRNTALCLKALHRYGEAIDEIEAMLAAGDEVKPETREAGKTMLAELNAIVGTVKIKVVLHRAKSTTTDVPPVEVSVDGTLLPPEKVGTSVRLGPGDHVVVAKAPGYGDATKTVSVVSGDKDVVAQLDLMPAVAGTALGALRVHASVPTATISIDGVAIANGTWEGGLPAGKHHVEAHADKQPTWSRDIDVAPGQRLDLEATIGADATTPPVPPVYDEKGQVVMPKKAEARPWYLMGGIGGFTSIYTVHESAFNGTSPRDQTVERGFNGLALNVRGGRDFGKFVSLEVFAEVGALKPVSWNYPNSTQQQDVTITYVQLGPELRVHSTGKVLRIVVGTGIAIEGVSVTQKNVKSPSSGESKGSGVEAAWVVEAGPQIRFAERLFLEGDLFLNLSGDGGVKEDGNRYFYDSPVVREGVRLFFGFTL